jgi:hypothetical protein
VKCHYNWIVVVQVLGHLQLLGKEERILLYHLVDHLLNHTKILEDVVLGQPLAVLK